MPYRCSKSSFAFFPWRISRITIFTRWWSLIVVLKNCGASTDEARKSVWTYVLAKNRQLAGETSAVVARRSYIFGGDGATIIPAAAAQHDRRGAPAFCSVFVFQHSSICHLLWFVIRSVGYSQLPARNCIYVQKFIINYCQLVNAGNSITLIWIPGHTGIRGNERVYEAAKAAFSLTVSTMKCPASDFIAELTMHYHELWQAEWDGCCANKLHSVKPHLGYCSVTHLSRRDAVILRRLCIGHTHVTHKYLPLCNKCECSLTVKHILLDCCSLKHVREKYFTCSSLENYLRMLMQQESWILSKKSTFIILFSDYCYVSILH